ncbi:MAG: family 10 glycosylhydrolase [Planctomycetota bacterium]|nr:family 10 glycosylhydrolase [Planctomycetota bacterium]
MRRPVRLRCALWFVRGLLSLLAVLTVAGTIAAEDIQLQLRCAWGGGTERKWSGTISLSGGRMAMHRPLGIEADEPGSIWVTDNRLQVRQRSARAYDGVDVFISAPADAVLSLEMSPEDSSSTHRSEVLLSDLIAKPYAQALDEQNNRLLIRRAPGDMLRVRLDRDALVYTTGERLQVDMQPHLLSVPENSTLRVKAQLIHKATGEERWSEEYSLAKNGTGFTPATANVNTVLPETEGVYDLRFEASIKNPLRWNKPLATRTVQLVVLADAVAAVAPAVIEASTTEWPKILEIDPTSSSWTDRWKTWSLMPGARQVPMGSGQMQIVSHSLGSVAQLNPMAPGTEPAWEAYPLTISKPGTPHVLEVEYPSDVAQTVGISLVEPNAAGAISPIGLDSGFYSTDETTGKPAAWTRHRLVFWPRTKSPIVLITNRRYGARAVFGKIRVFAGPATLPKALPNSIGTSERLLAAYMDRPFFCENFSANETLDPWSGRSLEEWQSFYEGGTRLVEYLNHAGFNGLMMSVLADGSTIYPSQLLDSTPRYDTGIFLDSGQDPYRKDGLEMLLRLFDREKLQLIPALQFSTPLPQLEEKLRQKNRAFDGIELIGAEGLPYSQVYPSTRGLAPYYNPLNDHVQEAMLAVVRELVQRYGQRAAFAGLAIELSADGYTQLPGELWGLDDRTIARFEAETKIKVPGNGPERFAQRAQFLRGKDRQAWLNWRAGVLARFHQRLHQELVSVRPDARFYLAATNLFEGNEVQHGLRPALPVRPVMEEALLGMGIVPSVYRQQTGMVFLRPRKISPPGMLTLRAIDLEIARSPELDRLASLPDVRGGLMLHEPQKAHLPTFDAKSPFGKDKTNTWLVSQLSPSGVANRQRFIHSLAAYDAESLFDGGWLLSLGQEESLKDFVATFRRLPAGQFETLAPATSPVTIRTLVRDQGTYVYFVNDSAWPVKVSTQVAMPAGARAVELSGRRRIPPIVGNQWTLELGPYDLVAVRFSASSVRLTNPKVTVPEEARLALEQRINDLRRRRIVLEDPSPLSILANASFEKSTAANEAADWTLLMQEANSATATVDANQAWDGKSSLRLVSRKGGAALCSAEFEPPRTGRLSLSVWMRIADAEKPPSVRLAIDGNINGAEYHPFAVIGAKSDSVLHTRWAKYIFPIEDLPTEGLSPLRIRFDLIGPGEVWIDHVQLVDLAFNQDERDQLDKLIQLWIFKLQAGQWGECQHELDSYWARYLAANVPLMQPAASPATVDRQTPASGSPGETGQEKQATRPGMMDRLNKLWKR